MTLLNWAIVGACVIQGPQAPIETPKATDDRLTVELIAREPDIVTPTGVAVDERGRVWAIENQTHQRPAEYKGPAGDRIRIYDDFAPGGRARRVITFAEGFKNGMGLALTWKGDVYFATRADIHVLRDTNGDDRVDEDRVIVRLDTPGDYPHNGLSGFAFDALDNVYFGFGENLGAPYRLIGSDGTTLAGGGEGGNIYRCRPDGSKLERIATGFWNPFHMTFDAFGRLFAVDNDPDSRPPCRLLHIIPGGDYGYRFRNGRKGLHPFTAWNGELPGTLPMVAGTGEAPSGIVAYESNGLPPEYVGDLIVTSWGDHVIQRFKLRERGASFTSQAETLVKGGENFYPVGIAIAADGSLVVTDWADKSYPLHGKGRLWRIRMNRPPNDDGLRPSNVAKQETKSLRRLLSHPKREIRSVAADALFLRGEQGIELLQDIASDPDARARIHVAWAREKHDPKNHGRVWLDAELDPSPAVRAEITRLNHARGWTSLARFRPGIDETKLHPFHEMQYLLSNQKFRYEITSRYLSSDDPFLAYAAFESLVRHGDSQLVLRYTRAENALVRVRAVVALRRCGGEVAHAALPQLLADPDPTVRRAAIQWVGEEKLRDMEPLLDKSASRLPVTRQLFEAFLATKELLAGISRKPTDEPSGEDIIVRVLSDQSQSADLRALALRSLRPDHPALDVARLQDLLEGDDSKLKLEAIRTLAMRPAEPSQDVLRHVAKNSQEGIAIRAEAVLGLAHTAASDETARVLLAMLGESNAELRREALRSLRGADGRRDVIEAVHGWREKTSVAASREEAEQAQLLLHSRTEVGPSTKSAERAAYFARLAEAAELGDAAAGERLFFHPRGPQCFACHRVNGRGGNVGPDLSAIGRTLDREKLVRSILEPSKDIAPQFTPWLFALRDGKVLSGIIVNDDPQGLLTVGDADGKSTVIKTADIEGRRALDQSIMPDNLIDRMTRAEFRDLLAYLSELK